MTPRTDMSVWLLLLTTSVILSAVNGTRTGYQRCFSCRSRGELGDCKDPFYLAVNTTEKNEQYRVKASPCASGWCKKFVVDPDQSGAKGDKNYIVDRGCLGGGPDDGKNRCFEVPSYHGSPPGYLCVCKGDLCNHGVVPRAPVSLVATALLIALIAHCT